MKGINMYSLLLCLVFAVISAGCGITQQAQLPAVKDMPDSFPAGADSNSIAGISWKDFFQDAHLTALIDTALKNNPDLFIALQRIEMARAQVTMKKAAFYPSVSGSVVAGAERFGDYTMNGVGNFDTNLSPNIDKDQQIPTRLTPDFFAGFRSSWEIDLWGKLKHQKKEAIAQLFATEKGRQLAVTHLIAEVADQYYELLALDNELKIVKKNVQLQLEALELVKVQKEGGRATELAVKQFSAQLLNTQAIEYHIRQQMARTENRLNIISGRYPQAIIRDTSLAIQQLPQQLKTGLPAQLLTRRPDIQQAEWELEAAEANVAAARAAFLPSVNLSPYIGFNAFRARLFLDPASFVYGAAAGLTAPIFNMKQIRSHHKLATARAVEAVYNYQKTLLNCYGEVMTNLESIKNNTLALNLKDEEVKELTNAVSVARDLYLAGYANYLEVISAQKGVLDAEIELTENKKRLFQSVVHLYRSLGGGWE
ncbi:MAG TPA: TolC family protein [Flavitalea sp.]|nr:TolC family protein [Flavitalea sp.]